MRTQGKCAQNVNGVQFEFLFFTSQMFKGTEDTEEDKEELTMDEKSPSVTSLNERTLFRQKSKSGSEKDQENEEKQIEDVRN